MAAVSQRSGVQIWSVKSGRIEMFGTWQTHFSFFFMIRSPERGDEGT
jgi:hypothetical protein